MQEVILIKNGELALKGLNRSTFEDMLIKNIKQKTGRLGEFYFEKSQSTIMITPKTAEANLREACEDIAKIFGIAAFSLAASCKKDFEDIKATAEVFLADELFAAQTFKVEAKRSDKRFPMTSPELCRELGGVLLEKYPHLRVDVHDPEVTVTVEIRDNRAFVHGNQRRGAGGMPTGTGGRAMLLVSGGIDSPVAGWMMAKRGIKLIAVHFASPPYTSPKAEMKVHELLKKVAQYSGRIELFTVPFTQIQEHMRGRCPEEFFTIVMRRLMMRIANEIAEREHCGALITGESMGQVASQTLHALACTDAVAQFPVFRPCIGMDKEEIITIARKIDTFDISIQPYEDCCTIFTPRHPRTRPTIEAAAKAEARVFDQAMLDEAINGAELKIIY
ncbi:MAG: tRNA 4-thiouridine(8) synthase ThiI [Oscillospiraceae bacterium]|jgi:thiamine biosynthesis protein ThiI|nr:tRNA 4-thiouridine(8) synthase ThiI [Oscillospiraceae bacterium]